MKKCLIAFLCVLTISACNRGTKSGGDFSIQGQISGMDSGALVLTHRVEGKAINDTLKVLQGQFNYSGHVTETAPYYLQVSDTVEPLIFFVDAQDIRISASKDSLSKAKVSGSDAEDTYMDYKAHMAPFDQQTESLNKVYAAADKKGPMAQPLQDSLEQIYDNIDKERQTATIAWVKSHPGSIVGAWAVSRDFLYEPDPRVLGDIYQSLDSGVRTSTYGRLIDTALIISRKLQIGQLAPDFSQADTSGNPLSLSSLRGKYVLVDFWASWCGPCRAENPNVVKAYNLYKDRGFTILGVSLDMKRDPWIKAIGDDHLDWNQVSDLKFWNNQVAKSYDIRGIPSNFLLDKEGRILARNLRGKKLDDALAGIFK